jgi:hypothetical protein
MARPAPEMVPIRLCSRIGHAQHRQSHKEKETLIAISLDPAGNGQVCVRIRIGAAAEAGQ